MLIEVKNLVKEYTGGLFYKRTVKAVNGVSFSIKQGETLGLVGESGCGKSTVARLLLMLIRPTSASIRFENTELTVKSPAELQKLRKEMQIIFQHPQQSLYPRRKIYEAMAEPLRIHKLIKRKEEEKEKILQLLNDVGLLKEHLERYPHELSGGQAQRVAIARVLALKPKFIVADEPTSMLDISVQAQILELMKKLQREHNIGMLFISHDLEVARAVSNRIAVMHQGRLVEIGDSEQVFMKPQHPYTKYLTDTTLKLEEKQRFMG
ncbi:ABC transporter related [Desulfofarcimen acetoxidans DSM 771]|uniref:ABC transporter related n=1 Tax=Desulfofarcimen acetoxidans (strain ATCC 49208 / DSM 771 / KCTC 5769 / VKM B-1644 / 5575) TaxID=485916 RepID=C8W525_DESAS|nr:ATP-binding cassette domain-containing protein [Desulfofarcimen acetoxidans]ACV61377.1 ABC transporter related [Desulfofarcimen acetoxidans DSM 771]